MYDGSITIICENELAETDRLHRILCRFCELHQVSSRAVYALNLAIDELVTNSILHGFGDDRPHQIKVEVVLEGSELRATIEDDGREFDPLSAAPVDITKGVSERALGGLGIHLVRGLVDQVEYRREDDRNRTTIRKIIR